MQEAKESAKLKIKQMEMQRKEALKSRYTREDTYASPSVRPIMPQAEMPTTASAASRKTVIQKASKGMKLDTKSLE